MGLGFGHALNAMPAALVPEEAVDFRTLDTQDDFLQPADFRPAHIESLDLEALLLAESPVHVVKIADKQSSLATAGPRTNLEDNGLDGCVFIGDDGRLERFEHGVVPLLELHDLDLGEVA